MFSAAVVRSRLTITVAVVVVMTAVVVVEPSAIVVAVVVVISHIRLRTWSSEPSLEVLI